MQVLVGDSIHQLTSKDLAWREATPIVAQRMLHFSSGSASSPAAGAPPAAYAACAQAGTRFRDAPRDGMQSAD